MMLTSVEIREAILMALDSLKANKLRSFLTILGVMIGVSSVIGLAAIINGLNGAMEQEIMQFGSATIIDIDRFPPDTDWDDLTVEERNRPYMTTGEAMAIKENCPSVDGVAPMNHYWAPGGNEAKYKNRKATDLRYLGTWPDYLRVKDKNLSQGRFIGPMDVDRRLMVCVIGHGVSNSLFEDEDPIDKEIRVNGDVFTVVGILEEVESNFGNDQENRTVIIPLSTKEKLQPWDKALSLAARAESAEKLDQAQEEITNTLRIYRRVAFNEENNFAFMTQDYLKDEIASITKYIYYAMLIITSVGLMVGGIGVMNIMLVSVTERTREIGVRKAIGAKRSNIVVQFLAEAMTLSGVGGLIGVVFGVVAGLGINAMIGFPLSVPVFWIIIGFVVAVSVGLISGVYPALKAAMLDPIEALRYE
jgi:putative ABC transport system permease protein